jgi:hypothetical protein
MNNLAELRDLFTKNQIAIKEFGGWYLKVDKDTWTMAHDRFYKNGLPQNMKEKNIFDNYKRIKQNDNISTQTRNWRGISCRNRIRN